MVKGWRSKLISTLLVFFAGFSTAIYILAPAPKSDATEYAKRDEPKAKFNSEEFVEDFNSGMHKCIEFGKEAALRTGKLIREKFKEMHDA